MSVRMVAQIHATEAAARTTLDHIAQRLDASSDAVAEFEDSHAGVHSPGSMGGGQLTWDVAFASDAECGEFCKRVDTATPLGLLDALGPAFRDLRALVSSAEAAVIEPVRVHIGAPGLAGIKRTLWIRVSEDTRAEDVEQWERELLVLPSQVPAIRNWSFSRVRTTAPHPMPVRWTHLWEQEFETADALHIDYMASPYHWGHLDGWFDLEHPKCIVDPWLAHLYGPARESVLSWTAP